MATYSTSQFKPGLKILVDGDPHSILVNDIVKPGKGQAFNRIKIRNLKNGRVGEKTLKSGELSKLNIEVKKAKLKRNLKRGIF